MSQDVVSPLRSDPKALDVLIGSKVRGRMAEKNVTQEVVAHVLGMEQQSVSKRLSGQRPFKAHELFQVADLLGISVSAMLDDMTLRPGPGNPGRISAGKRAVNTARARLADLTSGRSFPATVAA